MFMYVVKYDAIIFKQVPFEVKGIYPSNVFFFYNASVWYVKESWLLNG